MNELIAEFLPESRELVEQATRDLLALEQEPANGERLDSAFRAFHTLKGGAGIVDFTAMETAVHAAENVLTAARSGSHPITTLMIEDCLKCLDQVISWLDVMQSTDGELPPRADTEAGAIVARFAHYSAAVEERVAADPSAGAGARATGGSDAQVLDSATRDSPALSGHARELLEAQILLLDARGAAHGVAGRIASAGRAAANVLRHVGRSAAADRIAHATDAAVTKDDPVHVRHAIETALREFSLAAAEPARSPTRPDVAARTLRVDAARIDTLVKLTGELTVANNAIGHAAKLARDEDNSLASILKGRHAVLDRLVRELQEVVVAMRVLPLRHVFQRFPRLVREISTDLGKPATLLIEGEDTEADKAIVEMLFEPLLHVLRNAIDHGVEDAADRAAYGKPPVATIRLRAQRQGEHVLVEVTDDGRGIDLDRVRKVALQHGLVVQDTLAVMSDTEVVDLIFVPGFSTSAEVTGLSGRGVGMDAVRTAVQRLAGQVVVNSRPGQGTTVRFTLPFSAIMTRIMTVEAGGQLFGIPLDAIVETIRIRTEDIVSIGAARAIVLRDQTVPLIELAGTLGVKASENRRQTEATIVVTNIEGQRAAVRVDRLGERIEVMLKPLEGFLSAMPGIAGSTLLGDGSVLLVLDLLDLLQ